MENKSKKRKKKELIVLILLLLVLCGGAVTSGILFLQKNDDKVSSEGTEKPVEKNEVANVSSSQLTVMVKSDTGVVLPNVLVSIYDAEGNAITSPEATDAVGRLIYTPEKEGTYGASVVAAPYQYSLDREVYYFEKGNNLLSIVLKEDPTAQVAQIGDMKYTLRDAIKAANASKEDVTIKLLHDVYVVNELYFNNKAGKTITIDGNGKTVTYLANATAFSITQKAGTVHFKNMKISHNGEGAVFRTSNAINLNLTDITINAKNDTKGYYKWSLINLFGQGKTNLTMTRVKIDMDITTIESGASGAAVIRTGNAGKTKDIKITMNNCHIDATGAKGRAGIRVTEDTTANVVFNNTTFLTQNNYVIAVDGQLNWSQKNSKLGSQDEYYNEHPVPDVIATVGKTKFYSLNAAVKKASELGGKTPVKLVGDVSLVQSTTFSGKGITAVIDGNGHTITTEGGNTIFKISGDDYKLTFKNMTINHGGYDRLLQYEVDKENINVTWENVKVVASGTSEDACYKYGLMNLRGSGSFTMKSSSITLNVPKIINGSAAAVIRTGNSGDGQTLTITLNNSTIDASATKDVCGIYAQKGTTANIVLKDYEIHTNNKFPVYVHADDGDVKLTFDSMDTWSSKSGSIGWLCNLMSLLNMKDAAKIGDTVYATLPEAINAAKEVEGEVTITLLRDCVISSRTDLKTSNSSIIIDGGNEYTLTTKGSALMFVLDNDDVSLTFKDITIEHNGYDRLVTFNQKAKGEVWENVNLTFDNVTMTASGTSADKCYPYGVFNLRASGGFTMIDSSIKVESEKVFGGDGYSVIRLGNANDGQTVNITMENSIIDAANTENIAGIYVSEGATAIVKTFNSTIKTKDKHAVNVNAKGHLNFKPANTSYTYGDALTNCAVKIGNDYYVGISDAWAVAKASTTPTTITLLKDYTATGNFATLGTANADVTIDGDNKYTLTTTKNGANIFTFGANNVSLTFKDIVIKHQGNDRFVTTNKTDAVTYSNIKLVLDNVTMTASGTTSDKCYPYGVFNIRANGSVELIGSTITLDVETTTGGADCGVIRLGNNDDGTSVDVTMSNSTIDASKTKKISGIYVNGGVTADVKVTDSAIKTNNRYAIDVNTTGTLTLEVSNTTWTYTDSITNRVARIGDNYYASLVDAWNVARTSTTPTTIVLVNNCTVDSNFATLGTANANITIDGADKYTLTTTKNDTNIFTFGANNVSLTFKDIVIKHQGNDRFVTTNKTDAVTYSNIKLVLDNVTMTASGTTSDKCYPYGVFNIRANGSVELIGSTITLDVETTTGGADCGVIRLGNSDDGTSVDITMTNSTIDASKTKKIAGIYVNGGVTADIKLTDSTLKTNNRYAINVNATGTVTLKESNAQWSCTDRSAGINSITNLAAKIGKDCYMTFEDAWAVAKASTTPTTITLLNDVTLTTQLPTISKDGTDITIDGQNKKYTLTAALTVDNKNVIDIGLGGTEKKANLTLQNMKITHKTQRALVGVGQNAKSSAQINVNNVEITVDYTDTNYYLQYGVFNMRGSATLIMTDVTTVVKSGRTGTDRGIIRVGNNDDGAIVQARLQNCTFDTTQAADVAIARVNRGDTLDIVCQNCKFETKNAFIFNLNSTGGTFTATVDKYTEDNAVAGEKTELYNTGVQYEVVGNLAQASAGASINGFLYADARAAFDDAQLLDGYVTIKLLKDNTWPTSANVSMNTPYVNLTIDGQGQYKLTTGTKNKEYSAFYIENDNISLTLKDMDIHHISKRAIVAVKQRKNADGEAIGTGINISLENVDITTEAFDGTTKHDCGLINIRNNANLSMKDVKIDYKNSAPTALSTSYQVIRFGNKSSDDGTKTVTAVLENCEVNVNDGHSTAFFAHTGTTVNLTAKNCKFKNFKQNLVYRAQDSNLTLTWDNSTWNDKTGTKSELVYHTTCKEGYNCTITGASD